MRLLVSRRMHSIDANPLARVLFGAGHFLDSPGRTNGLLCVLQVPVPWMVWIDSILCTSLRSCSSWYPLDTRRAIPFPIPQRNASHRSCPTSLLVPTVSSAGTVPLRRRLCCFPLLRTRTSRTTTYPFLFPSYVPPPPRVFGFVSSFCSCLVRTVSFPPLLVPPPLPNGCEGASAPHPGDGTLPLPPPRFPIPQRGCVCSL